MHIWKGEDMKCIICDFLKVSDGVYKCLFDRRIAMSQDELEINCPLNCKHEKMMYEGSNICAKCGCVVADSEFLE